MGDSDFEGDMSRTSNRTRGVMRPPCAKLVSRIRASSFYLLGLHRKYQMSLTESAAFLRDGVLESWANTSAAKRQRMIWWAKACQTRRPSRTPNVARRPASPRNHLH